jgi:hypothetical protein
MSRLSVFAIAALLALPTLGHAAQIAGSAKPGVNNVDTLEVSAARRHRYHQSRSRSASTRFTVRPAHRYGWRYRPPYGPHPSDLASNSHPYFVPGAPKFAPGFRHNGFGTEAYGFGYQ